MGKGFAATVVSLLLVLGSCGSTSRSPTSGSGTSPWETSPTTSPTTPAGFTFGPATSPVDPIGSHVVAKGGRVSGDDEHGMDMLWWDFAGGAPRCVGEYVRPPVVDEQTGLPVAVAGIAFLRLRCSPVHALQLVTVDPEVEPPRFPDQLGRYRLSGDSEFPPARNIVEVVQTGWGDGVLTITVGLRRRAPFGIGWVGGSETPGTGANDVSGAMLGIMQ